MEEYHNRVTVKIKLKLLHRPRQNDQADYFTEMSENLSFYQDLSERYR